MSNITFFVEPDSPILEDFLLDSLNWKEIKITNNLYKELIPYLKYINEKPHYFSQFLDNGEEEIIPFNLEFLDDEKRKNLIIQLEDFFLAYLDKCDIT